MEACKIEKDQHDREPATTLHLHAPSLTLPKAFRRACKQRFHKIVPYLFVALYYPLMKSWRFEFEGPEAVFRDFIKEGKRQPCIFSFWHSDDMALGGLSAFRDVGIMVSHSRDGALVTRALQLLGFKVFRGSSSRGGANGLKGLASWIKAGHQVSVAVDGPRGPAFEVKPGVIELARRTEKPIVPVRAFTKSAWILSNTWNEGYLPKPFATVHLVFDEPVTVPAAGDREAIDYHCGHLKSKLDNIFPSAG